MKKIGLLLVIVSVMSAVLAGCSGDKAAEGDAAKTETPAAETK